MPKALLSMLFCLLAFIAISQNPLEAFENLAESTWVMEGRQLGGHEGKTVKEFIWGLDRKMVKVKTYTTDPETLEFGLRNEGIRIFNTESQKIEFYEFDKFGGVSIGEIIVESKDLHYEYQYGDLVLRDSWLFVHKDQYTYRVASVKNGKLDQVYHQGSFFRK